AYTLAGMLHERVLAHLPVTVRLRDGTQTKMVPDAWLDLRITDHAGLPRRYCYCMELDRGTMEQKRWRRKVAALVAYANGPYQASYGTNVITILVVTPLGE